MIDLFPFLDWTHFVWAALPAIVLLTASAVCALRGLRPWALVLGGLALLCLAFFIGGMWHSLERPPMRTMGETRLWYSFFVILAGLVVYIRWRYVWILSFSGVLASVFMMINILKPEIHNKTMMPALESPYFVPHVISYIFAYALLGAALLVGIYILYRDWQETKGREVAIDREGLLRASDNLVYTGMAFLMIGLLLGCLWAKVAWGTYWGWDPKETWAAITMLSYLLFVHHRLYRPRDYRTSYYLLALSFVCLQICWWGVNLLPSAQGVSIHTYS